MTTDNIQVRRPRYADNQWYSASPSQLQTDIEQYLAQTPRETELGTIVGLVAPHAGHFFSGPVAGAAFKQLPPGAFQTVILIGPDHRGLAPGHIATLSVQAWQTPLGDIPVDWELLDALQQHINVLQVAADDEHSLEIELPFLQVTLQDFNLVPLIMGSQSRQLVRSLGQALAGLISGGRQDVLLVASSDLSHFFDDATARRLDEGTLQFVLDMDADGLMEHVETARRRGEPLACGAGPIAAVIHAAKASGAGQAHLIKYATSADVSGRTESVVGYAAVALCR